MYVYYLYYNYILLHKTILRSFVFTKLDIYIYFKKNYYTG